MLKISVCLIPTYKFGIYPFFRYTAQNTLHVFIMHAYVEFYHLYFERFLRFLLRAKYTIVIRKVSRESFFTVKSGYGGTFSD